MNISEKFYLKWKDFEENVCASYISMREDNEFSDVTLVCDGGRQIEAHKVILASSSPFFKQLLSKNKHSHPLVFMRGVNLDDLVAIVDFVYLGEANIYEENLESFLNIAEELSLKGLNRRDNDSSTNIDNAPLPTSYEPCEKMSTQKVQTFKIESKVLNDDQINSVKTLALPKQDIGEPFQNIDQSIASLIQSKMIREGNSWACSDCSHTSVNRTHMSDGAH